MRAAFLAVALLQIGMLPLLGQPILTLEEAVRLYRERNPALQAQREALRASEEELLQSRLLPNPQLSLSMEGFPFGAERDTSFFEDQEFLLWANQRVELGGKRGRRQDVARSDVELSRIAIQELEVRQVAELKKAYLQTYFAGKKVNLAREQFDLYEEILRIHEHRKEAGDVSGLSHLRIELEEVRFLRALSEAQLEFRRAWTTLAALIGWIDGNVPELIWGEGLPPETPALEKLQKRSQELRPDLRRRNLAVERASYQVELEKARSIPDLTFGGGYKRDFGIDSYFASVTAFLPLFDRNQGRIGGAQAELRRSRNEFLWQQLVARAEVERFHRGYREQREHLQRLEGEILDKARTVLHVTRQAYWEGESSLMDYLDALRTNLETRLAYHDLLRQLHETHVALERAVGGSWD